MARQSNYGVCSAASVLNRRILFFFIILLSGCASQKKTTVGLDVDVYMHPTSADPADILLQTGIGKRLAEDSVTKSGIIHVRVNNGMVILSGAVKSDAIKSKARQVALDTEVRLNGTAILPDRRIENQIEVQP